MVPNSFAIFSVEIIIRPLAVFHLQIVLNCSWMKAYKADARLVHHHPNYHHHYFGNFYVVWVTYNIKNDM